MFNIFMITKVEPVMASIGNNINQMTQQTKSEMDGIVLGIALLMCGLGVVISFFKKAVGLSVVGMSVVLYALYYLIPPILEFVRAIVGG